MLQSIWEQIEQLNTDADNGQMIWKHWEEFNIQTGKKIFVSKLIGKKVFIWLD